MTETYIAPPSGAPNATLARDQVLNALAEAGVAVASQEEKPGTRELKWWIVCAALEGLGWKVDEENTG